MIAKSVVNFINRHDDLIDNELWRDLLIEAGKELVNREITALVNVLQDALPYLDLGDIQWELYYEHLEDRISNLKVIMSNVMLWKILDDMMFYGLAFNTVKFGLLDDPDFEWKEIKFSASNISDYKLVRWKGKAI